MKMKLTFLFLALAAFAAAGAWWMWLSPRALQREVVRSFLNDPASAEFRGDDKAPRGSNMWCGEVNARNRMGGLVGFTRYIATVSDDRRLAEFVDEVAFDGQAAGSPEFSGKWRAFCTSG